MPQDDGDEEVDYMTMAFPDVEDERRQESSLRRAERRRREGLARGRVPSKAELEAEEKAKREAALQRPLDTSSKGFKMMQKLGFKGGALGKDGSNKDSLTEPLVARMKQDRGGIGTSKLGDKRKASGSPDQLQAPNDEDLDEYRMWRQHGAKGDKLERTVRNAMQTTRNLDEDLSGEPVGPETPTEEINILWRALVRGSKPAQKRRKRSSYELHFPREGLSSSARVSLDPDSDNDLSGDIDIDSDAIQDEETDKALEEFLALAPTTRLAKIIEYQRQIYHHCMWCGITYPDSDMEGCPGFDEADHE